MTFKEITGKIQLTSLILYISKNITIGITQGKKKTQNCCRNVIKWIRGQQDVSSLQLYINVLMVSLDVSIQAKGASGNCYQSIYELIVTHL